MTVDEIKKHYGFKFDAQVARKFKVSRATVRKWRKSGIPDKRQSLIEKLTKKKLKANLNIDDYLSSEA